MGGAGARASPVMEAPFLREGTTIRVLSDAPSRFFFRRDGISIRPYRYTLPPKMTKKNDDLHFKRFFQCFSFLSDVPSSKKRRKILINVPFVRFSLFTYPPGRFFLSALFLRGPSAGFGPVRPQGYVDKGRLSLPQPLIDAPLSYKRSSVCFRRLQVSGPPLPENSWRDFSFHFSSSLL